MYNPWKWIKGGERWRVGGGAGQRRDTAEKLGKL